MASAGPVKDWKKYMNGRWLGCLQHLVLLPSGRKVVGARDVSSADNVGGPNRDETGAKGKWSMLAIISQHRIGEVFDSATGLVRNTCDASANDKYNDLGRKRRGGE